MLSFLSTFLKYLNAVTKSHEDNSNDDNDFKHACIIVIVIKSHEGDSDDSNSKHACIIVVFLLIKFLYLFIHLLNYLFRFIQTFIMLINFINFITVFSSITYYLLNSFLKLIFLY